MKDKKIILKELSKLEGEKLIIKDSKGKVTEITINLILPF